MKNLKPRCGSAYRQGNGEIYFVAQVVANKYCLIGLRSGNRFIDPVAKIGDIFNGKNDEFSSFPISDLLKTLHKKCKPRN